MTFFEARPPVKNRKTYVEWRVIQGITILIPTLVAILLFDLVYQYYGDFVSTSVLAGLDWIFQVVNTLSAKSLGDFSFDGYDSRYQILTSERHLESCYTILNLYSTEVNVFNTIPPTQNTNLSKDFETYQFLRFAVVLLFYLGLKQAILSSRNWKFTAFFITYLFCIFFSIALVPLYLLLRTYFFGIEIFPEWTITNADIYEGFISNSNYFLTGNAAKGLDSFSDISYPWMFQYQDHGWGVIIQPVKLINRYQETIRQFITLNWEDFGYESLRPNNEQGSFSNFLNKFTHRLKFILLQLKLTTSYQEGVDNAYELLYKNAIGDDDSLNFLYERVRIDNDSISQEYTPLSELFLYLQNKGQSRIIDSYLVAPKNNLVGFKDETSGLGSSLNTIAISGIEQHHHKDNKGHVLNSTPLSSLPEDSDHIVDKLQQYHFTLNLGIRKSLISNFENTQKFDMTYEDYVEEGVPFQVDNIRQFSDKFELSKAFSKVNTEQRKEFKQMGVSLSDVSSEMLLGYQVFDDYYSFDTNRKLAQNWQPKKFRISSDLSLNKKDTFKQLLRKMNYATGDYQYNTLGDENVVKNLRGFSFLEHEDSFDDYTMESERILSEIEKQIGQIFPGNLRGFIVEGLKKSIGGGVSLTNKELEAEIRTAIIDLIQFFVETSGVASNKNLDLLHKVRDSYSRNCYRGITVDKDISEFSPFRYYESDDIFDRYTVPSLKKEIRGKSLSTDTSLIGFLSGVDSFIRSFIFGNSAVRLNPWYLDHIKSPSNLSVTIPKNKNSLLNLLDNNFYLDFNDSLVKDTKHKLISTFYSCEGRCSIRNRIVIVFVVIKSALKYVLAVLFLKLSILFDIFFLEPFSLSTRAKWFSLPYMEKKYILKKSGDMLQDYRLSFKKTNIDSIVIKSNKTYTVLPPIDYQVPYIALDFTKYTGKAEINSSHQSSVLFQELSIETELENNKRYLRRYKPTRRITVCSWTGLFDNIQSIKYTLSSYEKLKRTVANDLIYLDISLVFINKLFYFNPYFLKLILNVLKWAWFFPFDGFLQNIGIGTLTKVHDSWSSYWKKFYLDQTLSTKFGLNYTNWEKTNLAKRYDQYETNDWIPSTFLFNPMSDIEYDVWLEESSNEDFGSWAYCDENYIYDYWDDSVWVFEDDEVPYPSLYDHESPLVEDTEWLNWELPTLYPDYDKIEPLLDDLAFQEMDWIEDGLGSDTNYMENWFGYLPLALEDSYGVTTLDFKQEAMAGIVNQNIPIPYSKPSLKSFLDYPYSANNGINVPNITPVLNIVNRLRMNLSTDLAFDNWNNKFRPNLILTDFIGADECVNPKTYLYTDSFKIQQIGTSSSSIDLERRAWEPITLIRKKILSLGDNNYYRDWGINQDYRELIHPFSISRSIFDMCFSQYHMISDLFSLRFNLNRVINIFSIKYKDETYYTKYRTQFGYNSLFDCWPVYYLIRSFHIRDLLPLDYYLDSLGYHRYTDTYMRMGFSTTDLWVELKNHLYLFISNIFLNSIPHAIYGYAKVKSYWSISLLYNFKLDSLFIPFPLGILRVTSWNDYGLALQFARLIETSYTREIPPHYFYNRRSFSAATLLNILNFTKEYASEQSRYSWVFKLHYFRLNSFDTHSLLNNYEYLDTITNTHNMANPSNLQYISRILFDIKSYIYIITASIRFYFENKLLILKEIFFREIFIIAGMFNNLLIVFNPIAIIFFFLNSLFGVVLDYMTNYLEDTYPFNMVVENFIEPHSNENENDFFIANRIEILKDFFYEKISTDRLFNVINVDVEEPWEHDNIDLPSQQILVPFFSLLSVGVLYYEPNFGGMTVFSPSNFLAFLKILVLNRQISPLKIDPFFLLDSLRGTEISLYLSYFRVLGYFTYQDILSYVYTIRLSVFDYLDIFNMYIYFLLTLASPSLVIYMVLLIFFFFTLARKFERDLTFSTGSSNFTLRAILTAPWVIYFNWVLPLFAYFFFLIKMIFALLVYIVFFSFFVDALSVFSTLSLYMIDQEGLRYSSGLYFSIERDPFVEKHNIADEIFDNFKYDSFVDSSWEVTHYNYKTADRFAGPEREIGSTLNASGYLRELDDSLPGLLDQGDDELHLYSTLEQSPNSEYSYLPKTTGLTENERLFYNEYEHDSGLGSFGTYISDIEFNKLYLEHDGVSDDPEMFIGEDEYEETEDLADDEEIKKIHSADSDHYDEDDTHYEVIADNLPESGDFADDDMVDSSNLFDAEPGPLTEMLDDTVYKDEHDPKRMALQSISLFNRQALPLEYQEIAHIGINNNDRYASKLGLLIAANQRVSSLYNNKAGRLSFMNIDDLWLEDPTVDWGVGEGITRESSDESFLPSLPRENLDLVNRIIPDSRNLDIGDSIFFRQISSSENDSYDITPDDAGLYDETSFQYRDVIYDFKKKHRRLWGLVSGDLIPEDKSARGKSLFLGEYPDIYDVSESYLDVEKSKILATWDYLYGRRSKFFTAADLRGSSDADEPFENGRFFPFTARYRYSLWENKGYRGLDYRDDSDGNYTSVDTALQDINNRRGLEVSQLFGFEDNNGVKDINIYRLGDLRKRENSFSFIDDSILSPISFFDQATLDSEEARGNLLIRASNFGPYDDPDFINDRVLYTNYSGADEVIAKGFIEDEVSISQEDYGDETDFEAEHTESDLIYDRLRLRMENHKNFGGLYSPDNIPEYDELLLNFFRNRARILTRYKEDEIHYTPTKNDSTPHKITKISDTEEITPLARYWEVGKAGWILNDDPFAEKLPKNFSNSFTSTKFNSRVPRRKNYINYYGIGNSDRLENYKSSMGNNLHPRALAVKNGIGFSHILPSALKKKEPHYFGNLNRDELPPAEALLARAGINSQLFFESSPDFVDTGNSLTPGRFKSFYDPVLLCDDDTEFFDYEESLNPIQEDRLPSEQEHEIINYPHSEFMAYSANVDKHYDDMSHLSEDFVEADLSMFYRNTGWEGVDSENIEADEDNEDTSLFDDQIDEDEFDDPVEDSELAEEEDDDEDEEGEIESESEYDFGNSWDRRALPYKKTKFKNKKEFEKYIERKGDAFAINLDIDEEGLEDEYEDGTLNLPIGDKSELLGNSGGFKFSKVEYLQEVPKMFPNWFTSLQDSKGAFLRKTNKPWGLDVDLKKRWEGSRPWDFGYNLQNFAEDFQHPEFFISRRKNKYILLPSPLDPANNAIQSSQAELPEEQSYMRHYMRKHWKKNKYVYEQHKIDKPRVLTNKLMDKIALGGELDEFDIERIKYADTTFDYTTMNQSSRTGILLSPIDPKMHRRQFLEEKANEADVNILFQHKRANRNNRLTWMRKVENYQVRKAKAMDWYLDKPPVDEVLGIPGKSYLAHIIYKDPGKDFDDLNEFEQEKLTREWNRKRILYKDRASFKNDEFDKINPESTVMGKKYSYLTKKEVTNNPPRAQPYETDLKAMIARQEPFDLGEQKIRERGKLAEEVTYITPYEEATHMRKGRKFKVADKRYWLHKKMNFNRMLYRSKIVEAGKRNQFTLEDYGADPDISQEESLLLDISYMNQMQENIRRLRSTNRSFSRGGLRPNDLFEQYSGTPDEIKEWTELYGKDFLEKSKNIDMLYSDTNESDLYASEGDLDDSYMQETTNQGYDEDYRQLHVGIRKESIADEASSLYYRSIIRPPSELNYFSDEQDEDFDFADLIDTEELDDFPSSTSFLYAPSYDRTRKSRGGLNAVYRRNSTKFKGLGLDSMRFVNNNQKRIGKGGFYYPIHEKIDSRVSSPLKTFNSLSQLYGNTNYNSTETEKHTIEFRNLAEIGQNLDPSGVSQDSVYISGDGGATIDAVDSMVDGLGHHWFKGVDDNDPDENENMVGATDTLTPSPYVPSLGISDNLFSSINASRLTLPTNIVDIYSTRSLVGESLSENNNSNLFVKNMKAAILPTVLYAPTQSNRPDSLDFLGLNLYEGNESGNGPMEELFFSEEYHNASKVKGKKPKVWYNPQLSADTYTEYEVFSQPIERIGYDRENRYDTNTANIFASFSSNQGLKKAYSNYGNSDIFIKNNPILRYTENLAIRGHGPSFRLGSPIFGPNSVDTDTIFQDSDDISYFEDSMGISLNTTQANTTEALDYFGLFGNLKNPYDIQFNNFITVAESDNFDSSMMDLADENVYVWEGQHSKYRDIEQNNVRAYNHVHNFSEKYIKTDLDLDNSRPTYLYSRAAAVNELPFLFITHIDKAMPENALEIYPELDEEDNPLGLGLNIMFGSKPWKRPITLSGDATNYTTADDYYYELVFGEGSKRDLGPLGLEEGEAMFDNQLINRGFFSEKVLFGWGGRAHSKVGSDDMILELYGNNQVEREKIEPSDFRNALRIVDDALESISTPRPINPFDAETIWKSIDNDERDMAYSEQDMGEDDEYEDQEDVERQYDKVPHNLEKLIEYIEETEELPIGYMGGFDYADIPETGWALRNDPLVNSPSSDLRSWVSYNMPIKLNELYTTGLREPITASNVDEDIFNGGLKELSSWATLIDPESLSFEMADDDDDGASDISMGTGLAHGADEIYDLLENYQDQSTLDFSVTNPGIIGFENYSHEEVEDSENWMGREFSFPEKSLHELPAVFYNPETNTLMQPRGLHKLSINPNSHDFLENYSYNTLSDYIVGSRIRSDNEEIQNKAIRYGSSDRGSAFFLSQDDYDSVEDDSLQNFSIEELESQEISVLTENMNENIQLYEPRQLNYRDLWWRTIETGHLPVNSKVDFNLGLYRNDDNYRDFILTFDSNVFGRSWNNPQESLFKPDIAGIEKDEYIVNWTGSLDDKFETKLGPTATYTNFFTSDYTYGKFTSSFGNILQDFSFFSSSMRVNLHHILTVGWFYFSGFVGALWQYVQDCMNFLLWILYGRVMQQYTLFFHLRTHELLGINRFSYILLVTFSYFLKIVHFLLVWDINNIWRFTVSSPNVNNNTIITFISDIILELNGGYYSVPSAIRHRVFELLFSLFFLLLFVVVIVLV